MMEKVFVLSLACVVAVLLLYIHYEAVPDTGLIPDVALDTPCNPWAWAKLGVYAAEQTENYPLDAPYYLPQSLYAYSRSVDLITHPETACPTRPLLGFPQKTAMWDVGAYSSEDVLMSEVFNDRGVLYAMAGFVDAARQDFLHVIFSDRIPGRLKTEAIRNFQKVAP